MRKKVEEPIAKPSPLKLGDNVKTPISLYSGQIVKIEEKRMDYRSYNGCIEYREITVKLPVAVLNHPTFRDVLFVCNESELVRA